MLTAIKSERIVLADRILSGYVYIKDGRIVEVADEKKPCDTLFDLGSKYVSAGWIDLHTHGGGGFDFIHSSAEDVINGCNFHLSHGTTTILPTLSAAPFEDLFDAMGCISAARASGRVESNLLGAHIEGPYLSLAQCGAQCPTFITPPIPEQYQKMVDHYGKDIARWTYAPENDPEGRFAAYLTDHGILPSAGHTDATYPAIEVAAQNGMRLITHLYSCTSTVTRKQGFRSLGVIESAYLLDDLFVEIIADGKHLPPDLIRMIIKIKGIDRVALVTDSLHIAGTDIKEGVMSGTPFIIEEGVARLRDRSAFAGSIATADVLLRTLVTECKFSIPDAVTMMTATPASILDIRKGRLQEGHDADITVFDDTLTVTDVFVGGIKKL